MKQKILGVDIGSYSVKVAEMERSFRSFELVGFYEQPLHLLSTTEEGRHREMLALQRLFEEYNLISDSLNTALPGQLTAFRMIELPFSNFKKVDTTIEFEMENYLPLPLEEVVVDYQIVQSDKNQSKVLVTYARKGELIKFLNFFAGVELDPRFVGAECVEMANLVPLGVFVPEGAYAILDLGHRKTNVCLFSDKKLQLARTIMLGGKDLTQAVARSLKVPEEEAEKIKIEMGQVGAAALEGDTMTRQVSQALVPPLEDLLVQIRQTLLVFQEEKGEAVGALLLTGGTSRLGGVDQYLSKGLKKNVSFLDCLEIPQNKLARSDWCRPIATSALSYAYRGVIGSGNRDIQFRRGEFAYRGEVRDLVGLVREVGIQIGVITLFVLVTFLLSYASLRGKVKAQSQKIAAVAAEALPDLPKKSLENPTDVLSILTGRLNEVREKEKKIEEILQSSFLEVLKEISSKIPARGEVTLDVDDFTFAAERVRISGRTNSFEAVDQVKTALTQSMLFENVATENVRKGVGDEVKFDLTFGLKVRGEGGS